MGRNESHQRKRRSSICWRGRRELTDVRKPEIMVMTSLGEAIYWLLRSPSQTCHAKPKTQINRRWTAATFPLVGCLPGRNWPERLLSEKSDLYAVALQQIKERGALPMIDRGDIRQAIDHCSNIWASLPGAGYGQFEHKADSLIANSSGRNGQRDWCMSRVTAIISALVICIIVCLWAVVNHYRDNAITKPSATKMPENWSWRTRQLLTMQMRQLTLALDAKYTRGSWC